MKRRNYKKKKICLKIKKYKKKNCVFIVSSNNKNPEVHICTFLIIFFDYLNFEIKRHLTIKANTIISCNYN